MYFLCRLIPPRQTFPADMTPQEAETMKLHVSYWSGLLAQGKAIAFGPVADPAGAWGVGLLSVSSDAELRALQGADPALRLGMRYEAYPMPKLVYKGG